MENRREEPGKRMDHCTQERERELAALRTWDVSPLPVPGYPIPLSEKEGDGKLERGNKTISWKLNCCHPCCVLNLIFHGFTLTSRKIQEERNYWRRKSLMSLLRQTWRPRLCNFLSLVSDTLLDGCRKKSAFPSWKILLTQIKVYISSFSTSRGRGKVQSYSIGFFPSPHCRWRPSRPSRGHGK